MARDLARIRAEAYGEPIRRLETAYTAEWQPGDLPEPRADLPFCSDLETVRGTSRITQLNWSQAAGVACAGRWTPEMYEAMRRRYAGVHPLYIFHNAQADVPWLADNGIEVVGNLYDTMVATAILEPDLPNSLEHVTKDYAPDIEPWKHESATDIMIYGCKDADATWRVYEGTLSDLRSEGVSGVFNTSMQVLPLLIDLQRRGLRLDKKKAEEEIVSLKAEELRAEFDLNRSVREMRASRIEDACRLLDERLAEIPNKPGDKVRQRVAFKEARERLHSLVLPNWDSQPQVLSIFDDMGLPRRRGKDGKVTIDAAAIQELARQTGKDILLRLITYRETSKLRSTFFEKGLNDDGRIYPRYLLHRDYDDDLDSIEGACSGRLASKDPNIQNWPKRARRIIVPDDPGQEILEADYKQIEFRVIAWRTGGQLWEDVNKPGFDVHKVVAAAVYGIRLSDVTDEQRTRGKSCNYAAVYGVGPLTLSRQLAKKGIFLSVAECKRFIATFDKLYPDVKARRQEWVREAFATNKVTNPFGRFRRFYRPSDEATAIFNIYPQGTAGDIILRAMAKLRTQVPNGARIAIQVHDSLVLFSPREKRKEVVECVLDNMMQLHPEMPGFTTPVDLKVGESWGDLVGLKAA